jgi:hypothetical protein
MHKYSRVEEYNVKKGKWNTIQQGVVKDKSDMDKKMAEYVQQQKQIKKKVLDAKKTQRKASYKKAGRMINHALDFIEGKPKKQPIMHRKPGYIVRGGVAYPIHRNTSNVVKKPVKKKNRKDPFDFDILW